MKMLCNVKLSEHKYKTPEGYLFCEGAVLSRTGTQQYIKSEIFPGEESDEIIDVDRPYEEVFAKEALASFENKPMCNEHPNENVGPENYNELAVGHVNNIRQGKVDGEDVMLGDLLVTDAGAIEDIENGKTELSCGYDCDIEKDKNGKYKQVNIRGNHVALCEQGRAGIARIQDSIWKAPINDSVGKGSLIQEFGKQGKQYKITKIVGNVIYAESLETSKIVLFKKDEENIEWATITKSEVKDSRNWKTVDIILETDKPWHLTLNKIEDIIQNKYGYSLAEVEQKANEGIRMLQCIPLEYANVGNTEIEKLSIGPFSDKEDANKFLPELKDMINRYKDDENITFEIIEKEHTVKDTYNPDNLITGWQIRWKDGEQFFENGQDAYKKAKELKSKGIPIFEFSELWVDEFGYGHSTDMRKTLKDNKIKDMNPVAEKLMTWSFDDFVEYNEKEKAGEFRGSEATPYNLDAIKTWVNIRNNYKYVDDPNTKGNWQYLDIKKYHSKYGLNYIYIEPEQKLWRIRETGSEFYGEHGKKFVEDISIKDEKSYYERYLDFYNELYDYFDDKFENIDLDDKQYADCQKVLIFDLTGELDRSWEMEKKHIKQLIDKYNLSFNRFGFENGWYSGDEPYKHVYTVIIDDEEEVNVKDAHWTPEGRNGKLEDVDIEELILRMKLRRQSINTERIGPDGLIYTIIISGHGNIEKPEDLWVDIITEDKDDVQDRVYMKKFETYDELIKNTEEWIKNRLANISTIKDAAKLDQRIIDTIHNVLGEDVNIDYGMRGDNIVIRYKNKVSPYMAKANLQRLMKALEDLGIKVDRNMTSKNSNIYAIEIWHNSNLSWGDIRQWDSIKMSDSEEHDKKFYEKIIKQLEKSIKRLEKEGIITDSTIVDDDSDDEMKKSKKRIGKELLSQLKEYKEKLASMEE